MPDYEEEFRECDGCHSERLCRRYEEMWFCLKGPDKCWRQRKVKAPTIRAERRSNKAKR